MSQQSVAQRMQSMLQFLQRDLDGFSARFDAMDDFWSYATLRSFDNAGAWRAMGYVHNLVPDATAAIDVAKALYKGREPERWRRYLPFFAVAYKNTWLVYGCRGVRRAVRTHWKSVGEWDEVFTVISRHTAEVLYLRSMR